MSRHGATVLALALTLSLGCVSIVEKNGDCWRYFGEVVRHGDYTWVDCNGNEVTADTEPVSPWAAMMGMGALVAGKEGAGLAPIFGRFLNWLTGGSSDGEGQDSTADHLGEVPISPDPDGVATGD
jgi:hypothetical protein